MKRLLAALLVVVCFVSLSFAKWVDGYTKKNGTYVSGYSRSESNATVQDNYSYKGNSKPSTGKTGTNYYKSSPSGAYYDGTPKQTKTKNWWE